MIPLGDVPEPTPLAVPATDPLREPEDNASVSAVPEVRVPRQRLRF